MTCDAALQLDGFGVAFGEHVVLADVDLHIAPCTTMVLVGPAGTGKSTLIRTLAGLNDAQPALRVWGSVTVNRRPVTFSGRRKARRDDSQERRQIALVVQDARFLTASVRENLASGLANRSALTHAEQSELLCATLWQRNLEHLIAKLDDDVMSLPLGVQRRLAIVRASLSDPTLLCVDEGTANLGDEDASPLLELLEEESSRRAVLFVTHNKQHARALGGMTALLAGGRIQEVSTTSEFFATARTKVGAEFVRTGRCSVPGPMAKRDELDESVEAPPPLPEHAATAVASRFVGPRDFYWVRPGKLGGVPRPGIVAPLDQDLEGLQRLGVTILVTLEELETVSRLALMKYGIRSRFFPIRDMHAPTIADAEALCIDVEGYLARGEVVAMHCRGGMGRTGTMLACQLIWDGATAAEALQTVREINPKFVQSKVQVDFLAEFSTWLRPCSERESATITNIARTVWRNDVT